MPRLPVTDRQIKLIDTLRIKLGLRERDLEAITCWVDETQPIEWPLTRQSASRLITELQRRVQDTKEIKTP